MLSKNIYQYPLEKNLIRRRFLNTPPEGVYIDENGMVRNAPGHIVYRSGSNVTDLTNAVDFLCNVRSSICAGLDGTVHDLRSDIIKNYNGITVPSTDVLKEDEMDGNFVVIKHANWEYSIYSHLSKILVQQGESIQTGQRIALSGNTGWSIEPHLHFAVFTLRNNNLYSREIRWK